MPLTANEAAKIIGCSSRHVYNLMAQGKLGKIRKVLYRTKSGTVVVYLVPESEAARYRDEPQIGGWPRGRCRRHERKKSK